MVTSRTACIRSSRAVFHLAKADVAREAAAGRQAIDEVAARNGADALEICSEEGRLLRECRPQDTAGAVVGGLVLAIAVAQDPAIDRSVLRKASTTLPSGGCTVHDEESVQGLEAGSEIGRGHGEVSEIWTHEGVTSGRQYLTSYTVDL